MDWSIWTHWASARTSRRRWNIGAAAAGAVHRAIGTVGAAAGDEIAPAAATAQISNPGLPRARKSPRPKQRATRMRKNLLRNLAPEMNCIRTARLRRRRARKATSNIAAGVGVADAAIAA